jgi:hypothetical protein
MEVLLVLAEHPGEVVSKADLVDHAWRSGFIAENTVTHAVQELRAAFGDEPKKPRILETVHRRGYRLIPRPEDVLSDETCSTYEARYRLLADRTEILLPVGTTVLGRGHDVDALLSSHHVSRHHARITVSGDGATIEDLGSKNGTLLNDELVASATHLALGDALRFGDETFQFTTCHPGDSSTVVRLSR